MLRKQVHLGQKGAAPMSRIWDLREIVCQVAAQNGIPAPEPREAGIILRRLAQALRRDRFVGEGVLRTPDLMVADHRERQAIVDTVLAEEAVTVDEGANEMSEGAKMLLEASTFLHIIRLKDGEEGQARATDLCWIFAAIYRSFRTRQAA